MRELENTLCQAMILCDGEQLAAGDLPPRIRGILNSERSFAGTASETSRLSDTVKEATARVERMLIVSRLAQFRGTRTATAESLGISRKTLFNKMREYDLSGDDLDTTS